MTFFHDAQRRLLIYKPPSAFHIDGILQHIPGARQVNGTLVAVPQTLRNAQVLRWLNYPVAPVITDDNYDWPIEPGKKPLAHQKMMANFSVLHPRMFNLSDMGCVDAETEYLSPTGWKRIDQYDGKQVGQYHLDGRVTMIQPSAYVVRPCDWMYRFKTTRGVDQKLSSEHRVLYADYDGNLRLTTAEDIAEQQERQKQGWRGRFITSFIGGQSGIAMSDAELRVMVAVIADGHFPYAAINSCTISVKKERKKERLRALLTAASIEYKEKRLTWESKKGYSRFAFKAPRHDKEFTAYYWECSQAQLRIVADEIWRWDGSQLIGNRGPRFFSTSKASADFAQYVFTATENTASLSQNHSNRFCPGIYVVGARNKGALVRLTGVRTSGKKTSPITIEPTPDGKKYCFEVPTAFLVLRRNGCIFITGNTMKTLGTLWAADWLMQQYPPGEFRALIVAPLSILERVWANAIFANFLSRRTFKILYGDADKRIALLAEPADFYIVNFDGVGIGAHTHKRFELDGFSKMLAARSDIRLSIVDEASAYKDAQTKRHRIARQVLGKRDFLWMLTGTPTPNAPTDAYGLAKLVNNAWGKSFRSFQQETMTKITQFKWVPRRDGYEQARKLLSPSIRFDIKDVWNGPELTTQQREVQLTPEQKKHLADLKRDLQVTVKSGVQITSVNEAAVRTKFIQILLGGIYDAGHRSHVIDAKPRLEELKAVIEQAPSKLLVLVPLTNIVDLLYKELKQWTREVINGNTSQKERSRIFQAFQEQSDPRILIADPGTMAHGLDLYAAQTVVWYGSTDKTELYLQACKRAHRPGQTYPVTVVQLVSHPLEREIYRRLETNTSLQGALLDAVRKGEL